MEHQELDAAAALSQSIREFWYLEKAFGNSPSAFEVLPNGHAEIIFRFGSGCNLYESYQISSRLYNEVEKSNQLDEDY